jgi:hypothetical protein
MQELELSGGGESSNEEGDLHWLRQQSSILLARLALMHGPTKNYILKITIFTPTYFSDLNEQHIMGVIASNHTNLFDDWAKMFHRQMRTIKISNN